jgi:hypothetical protein
MGMPISCNMSDEQLQMDKVIKCEHIKSGERKVYTSVIKGLSTDLNELCQECFENYKKETETWHRYYDLEAIKRLRHGGQELLNNYLYFTVKRDGENVSMSLEDTIKTTDTMIAGITIPKISSHNNELASSDIVNRFKLTPEYNKTIKLLTDSVALDNDYTLYGELMKTVCPTGIERNKKHCHWILFDIYNKKTHKYLDYRLVSRLAHLYHIPVVECLGTYTFNCIEDLNIEIGVWLDWCKKHHREGIVIKDYVNQVFAKEKIDLPKHKPKLHGAKIPKETLPIMPEDRILRALKHTYDVVGEANWNNVKITMPEFARQISTEGREHNFGVPRDIFKIYKETPLSIIVYTNTEEAVKQ